MATAATELNTQIDNLPDEEMVRRILRGEAHLYEALVRRHSGRLFRAAISITRNEAEAEDVVQDAFVSAYRHLDQFEGRARFSTWLTRIAVHAALEHVGRNTREQPLDAPEAGGPVLLSRARNPEQCFAAIESAQLVRQALNLLPRNYRDVLVMRYLDEVNTAEAAVRLRITESNVKVRLHRACAMMRDQLAKLAGATPAAAAA